MRLRTGWVVVVAVLVLGVAGVLAFHLTHPAAVGAESDPSLDQLNQSVQAQITGTGPSDLAVVGVSSVVCIPPSSWVAGNTFKCYAYTSARREIGEYDGTIEPESGGQWRWNAQWNPA